MTNETKSELVVVRLPLMDEQIETFVQGSKCGSTPDECIRAIGTPVSAGGLETVRWGPSYTMPGRPSLFASARKAEHWATTPGRSIVAFVSKSDAAAQIAARDAKIAELTARLDTIAQETREACARICDGVSIMTAERHAAEFEVRAKSALQAENERLREALADPVAYRWTYPMPPGRDAIWHFGPDWPVRPDERGNKPIMVEPLFVAPSARLRSPNPECLAAIDVRDREDRGDA